jgi:hypothetical protein
VGKPQLAELDEDPKRVKVRPRGDLEIPKKVLENGQLAAKLAKKLPRKPQQKQPNAQLPLLLLDRLLRRMTH